MSAATVTIYCGTARLEVEVIGRTLRWLYTRVGDDRVAFSTRDGWERGRQRIERGGRDLLWRIDDAGLAKLQCIEPSPEVTL